MNQGGTGEQRDRVAARQGGRQQDKTGSKTVEQGRQWDRLVRQRDRRTSQRGDRAGSGTRQAAERGMQRNRARL